MPKFTKEQQQAIDEEGKNIIVSAGAGSGKTAVLSERVLRKLRDGVNINELLVLTFTNEAAGEMKNRIRDKISKDPSLEEQLNYIDSSYITTFDSYALSVVKKYHYLLNISNKINIVDSNIINSLKRKEIENIFEELYEKNDKEFLNLINDFCMKDDLQIKESILNISSILDLKVDKEEYLNTYLSKYFNDKYLENLIDSYEELINKKIEDLKAYLDSLEHYCDYSFYEKMYNTLLPLIESKTYDDYKLNSNVSLPRINKDVDEFGKEIKENISVTVKEIKSLLSYENRIDIKNILLSTKDYIKIIINIIKELDFSINNYKDEHGVYEFNDISKMAIKVVKENEEVREELKNFYNEILVDEYQDTNDLQETFINLISNNNVYMVGDVKQSIYRFRNANPTIFRNKYNNYSENSGGIKIDLLKNFRSRKEVLDNINLIFDYIMDDFIGGASYKKTHRMEFGNNSYIEEGITEQNYNLEIYNYDSNSSYQKSEIEAFIIANDIKTKVDTHYQIFDKDQKLLRNATYSDFCIIMDRGTDFETYKQIFEYLQIPLIIYSDEKLTNEYDILVIKNILGFIIKIKKREFDKEFRYLYTSICRSFIYDEKDNIIFNNLINNNIYNTEMFKISQDISRNIDHVSSLQILNIIIDKFNIYKRLEIIGDIEKSMIRITNLQNIAISLQDLGYTPYMFYDYLKEIVNSKDEIKYSLNTKLGDNVKIMNIHKSKGLEFNICYFSGLYKEFNISDLKEKFMYSNNYGIVTPYYKEGIGTTITKYLVKQKYIEEEISERIRLFYVALTRAKEKMIIVTSFSDKDQELRTDIVDNNERLKYKSFLDILESIKNNLKCYNTKIDLNSINLTKKYKTKEITNYEELIELSNEKLIIKENNISFEKEEQKHASKEIKELITKEDLSNMKYGTFIHYLFEITDFLNPVVNEKYQSIIDNFLNKIDLNNVKIYKEQEFIYKKDNIEYHGIIDLILEYDDHIMIIDYKLKNVTDKAYLKQLEIYKNYVSMKSNKFIKTYLYSILDEQLFEI